MNSMSRNEAPQRTAGKRPLRALTNKEKLVAIRRVHDGESKASVARDIGVPESTLRGWCKSEHKIASQVEAMKNSNGSFDALPSASDSDSRSTQGSPSGSPPANLSQTPGPSTSATKEPPEEESTTLPNKRIKLDNDIPSAAINISSSTSQLETYYNANLPQITSNLFYVNYLLSNPGFLKMFLDQQSVLSNKGLSSSMHNTLIDNGLTSGYSISNTSFNNVSMMGGNSMLNTISGQRDVNGKKTKYNRLNIPASTTSSFTRRTFKRPSPPPTTERENNLVSMPSTSSGIVNGTHVAGPTLSNRCKQINDIAENLRQKQTMKQEQQSMNNLNPEFLSQIVHHLPAMQNMLDERAVSGNTINNNNNNMHKNNNQLGQRKLNSLPPGIHEAAVHGTKFVTWLRQHGTPLFSFQQVKPVENIVDTLVAWAKPKETPLNFVEKQNSIS